MTITLEPPKLTELRPRITVVGVGGAGCNAVNNMIAAGLSGVEFVVANTDAQALAASSAEHRVQLGASLTEGLGAGAKPEIGQAAAEEAIEDIRAHVAGAHMVFVAGGMGGGTGTGAAAVIARTAKELGILTVGVVTKPFQFEGARRMRIAEAGIGELRKYVDTLIVIPNQNLFRIANDKTTFAEAFVLADQVLYSGVACIVDLIIKEGLINLDFADVRTVMSGMGTAMMGTGEATGERRAIVAAEEAISNPLLDDISLKGAKGLLLSITGGRNLTLYEVDEAASRVRQEVDPDANIIVGATFDEALGERVRVSIVASGMAGAGVSGAVAADRAPAPSAGKPASEFWPRAHAAPAAQTTAAPAPQAAVHRGPAEVHHQPGRPNEDVQRRLSEALQHGAAHAPQPPAGPAAPQAPHHEAARSSETWRGPGGVTIEEGPLHGIRDQHLPPPIPPVQVQSAPSHGSAFSPAPPAEIRRQPRRMPELEDFPPIGQREFRARRDQPGEGQRTVGDADWHPESEPKKRFSLFDRLRRRSQRAKEAEGFDNDQTGGWTEAEPDYSSVNNQIRAQTTGVPPHGGVSKSAERSDLPEFFSRKRR